MHNLFTYPQRLMTKLMHVAVVIVLIHALMPGAMLISHTHADKVTPLEALYGKQVAICKGDKMVYVDWSSLPKEHLPVFPSPIEGGALPSLYALVILLACVVLAGAVLWPRLFNLPEIPQSRLAERWLYWHRLLAHAPPR